MDGHILIRLYWIPHDGTGRLLVHRHMPGRQEFWESSRISESTVAKIDAGAQDTTEWRRLLCGMPLGTLTVTTAAGPVALYLLGQEGMRASQARLGLARTIADVSIRSSEVAGTVALGDGLLSIPRRERLAVGILPVLRRTLADLAPTPRLTSPALKLAEPGEIVPAHELRLRLAQVIRLYDVRGGQIGNHNLQVNRFVLRGPKQRLDFAPVLRNAPVKAAMHTLLADQTNAHLRHELADALRHGATGWTVSAQPLLLSARSTQPGFFEQLLAFDVHGLQVGNQGTQHNTFVYTVVAVPTAAALLRAHPELAVDLADYLCPPVGGDGDRGALRSRIDHTLANLNVDWDRNRNCNYDSPRPGAELHVFRTDGMTVGHHNRIRTVKEIAIHAEPQGLPPHRPPERRHGIAGP
ncbi:MULTISPECIES: hypothetical protein [Micromonospora]|uniref:Uncharacterized protein n=1 Tax=Micromonospora tulbaghiae TaxID=479978 RepID=A0ABY0KQT5_9ACTN|nr:MULTISPECIES: hypothetical protein [Micromonospora]PPA60439.1 hypothetical protein BAW75_01425 [Micromonospora chalcea]SCF01323.1 hypothetical protein GA0070562_5133 [Micromonospora tulbaghiae]